MNLKANILEVEVLEKYIEESKERGWIGSLDNIVSEYQALVKSLPYSWYFAESLDYKSISDNVKGNEMEFDALLFKLAKLKSRLVSYLDYSTIYIAIEFEELKKHIIDNIKKSKLTIDIAVAWLSDVEICRELVDANKRNIQIRILTIDCESNRRALNSLEKIVDVCYIKSNGNFMHNKFSIFDSEIIISGSYNWSYNAIGNDENIMIVINKEITDRFIIKFNELRTKYKS